MTRTDDVALGDDELVYRRILPQWVISEDGAFRPQSVSFTDRHTYEVSVYVATLSNVSDLMSDYPSDYLVSFRVGLPRSFGGIVGLTPEHLHPGHRVLCYPSTSRMRTAAKLISANCCWVIAP